MIKINNDFSVTHDQHNWTLIQFRDAVNKASGEKCKREYPTYYPTLEKVCIAFMDKACKSASDVDGILDTITRAKKEIAIMCEGIKKENVK